MRIDPDAKLVFVNEEGRHPEHVLGWTDLETTGLSSTLDVILEMAWQFTDFLGNPLSGWYSRLIKLDPKAQERANEVMVSDSIPAVMHWKNGLWRDLVLKREDAQSLRGTYADFQEAASELKHLGTFDRQRVRLAGSSVQFDQKFLERLAPLDSEVFSHRIFDLSSIRPLALAQGIDLDQFLGGKPGDTHRAADDVARDIAQWRGYLVSTGIAKVEED